VVCWSAPATAVTSASGSFTGVLWDCTLPKHSSPPALAPQPQTCPVVSIAYAVSHGIELAGIHAIVTPAGNFTRTGVAEFRVLPSPS
jgi:hypothetical protein